MSEKKFKLLKWIIDAEVLLSDCDLKTIPKSYLVDVLLLVFLVKVIVEAFNSNWKSIILSILDQINQRWRGWLNFVKH